MVRVAEHLDCNNEEGIQTPEYWSVTSEWDPMDLPVFSAWLGMAISKNCRICSIMAKRLHGTFSPVVVMHCTQADPRRV
jgi:hypothetical protein